jgi:hypothetical protein
MAADQVLDHPKGMAIDHHHLVTVATLALTTVTHGKRVDHMLRALNGLAPAEAQTIAVAALAAVLAPVLELVDDLDLVVHRADFAAVTADPEEHLALVMDLAALDLDLVVAVLAAMNIHAEEATPAFVADRQLLLLMRWQAGQKSQVARTDRVIAKRTKKSERFIPKKKIRSASSLRAPPRKMTSSLSIPMTKRQMLLVYGTLFLNDAGVVDVAKIRRAPKKPLIQCAHPSALFALMTPLLCHHLQLK